MSIMDSEGRFLQVNQALCTSTGYTEAELLTMTGPDLVVEEDRAAAAEFSRRLIEGGDQVADVDLRTRTKDGRVVWASLRGRRIPTPAGRPDRYLVHVRDITARKQAEEAWKEGEQRFKAIVESTRDWIWFCDAKGTHQYSNRAVQDILGYAPEEMVGNRVAGFMHPDDVLRARQQMQEAIAGRKGWSHLVIRWRHKDGGYRYLESAAAPAFDAQGELRGWHGADRDITARMEGEKALRESEEKYRALFEVLPVNITLHQDGKVVLVNEVSAGMFRVARRRGTDRDRRYVPRRRGRPRAGQGTLA